MARSLWIDNARGVAIALVVIGHVIQFGAHNEFDIFMNPVFIVIYAFHMPLFAALSGYLSFNSFQRRGSAAILKDRCRTLLLPLATWTIVGNFVVEFIVGLATTGPDLFAALRAAGQFFLHPNMTLWFLWFLLLSNVAMAIAVWLQKTLKGAAIPLSVVAISILPFADNLSIYQLKWLYPFFVGGYYLHKYKSTLRRFEGTATAVSAVLFVALIPFWERHDSIYVSRAALINGDGYVTVLSWGFRYILAVCGVIAIMGAIRIFSRKIKTPTLAAVGRATLGIYGTQTFLTMLIEITPSPSSSPLLYFLVYVPLVSAAVLAVSYIFSERCLRRVPLLSLAFLGEPLPRRVASMTPPR